MTYVHTSTRGSVSLPCFITRVQESVGAGHVGRGGACWQGQHHQQDFCLLLFFSLFLAPKKNALWILDLNFRIVVSQTHTDRCVLIDISVNIPCVHLEGHADLSGHQLLHGGQHDRVSNLLSLTVPLHLPVQGRRFTGLGVGVVWTHSVHLTWQRELCVCRALE